MPTNDYKAFASEAGADVVDQTTYAASEAVRTGYQVGIADPAYANKSWRQATMAAAVMGELFGLVPAAFDAVDDGDVADKTMRAWQTYLQTGYFEDVGVAGAMLTANPSGLTFPAPTKGIRFTIRANADCAGGATTLNWMGTGNAPLVYPDGTNPIENDWVQFQLLDVEYNGSVWLIISMPIGHLVNTVRQFLNSDRTFFVNASTGNDTTGDGSSGAPWQTRQHARDVVQNQYDTRGHVVEFRCTGNFTGQLNALGPLVGQNGPLGETWNFTTGSAVNTTNGSCFFVTGGAQFSIQTISGTQVALTATGGLAGQGHAIFVSDPGSNVIWRNVNFGACTQEQIYCQFGSFVQTDQLTTISGSAKSFIALNARGSAFFLNSPTITLLGTPAFSNGFTTLIDMCMLEIGLTTFVGGATGQRYAASGISLINTAGGGAAYLPGSVAGALGDNSVYL